MLSQDVLNKDFFPSSLWEAHFNPKTKRPLDGAIGKLTPPLAFPLSFQAQTLFRTAGTTRRKKKAKVDWSTLEAQGDHASENGEEGSQAPDDEEVQEEDYDQEDDEFGNNDYEGNYFNDGDDDNDEDLGDGGVGRDGGGDGEQPAIHYLPDRV